MCTPLLNDEKIIIDNTGKMSQKVLYFTEDYLNKLLYQLSHPMLLGIGYGHISAPLHMMVLNLLYKRV